MNAVANEADLSAVLARLADALATGPALLLTAEASAALCNVGVSTFLRRVAAGKMPRQVAMTDGLALWRRRDIERAVNKLPTRDRTPRTMKRNQTASRKAAEQEST